MPAKFRSSRIASLVAGFLVAAVLCTLGAAILIAREQATRDWRSSSTICRWCWPSKPRRRSGRPSWCSTASPRACKANGIVPTAPMRAQMGSAAAGLPACATRSQGLPQVDVATIVAANGDVINFTRFHPAPPINLADRDYFQAHLQQSAARRSISASRCATRATAQWTFYLSRRLNGPNGEFHRHWPWSAFPAPSWRLLPEDQAGRGRHASRCTGATTPCWRAGRRTTR